MMSRRSTSDRGPGLDRLEWPGRPGAEQFKAIRKVLADQPADLRPRVLALMEIKAVQDGDLAAMRAIRQYQAVIAGLSSPRPSWLGRKPIR
jgi:hypothetical protein